MSETILNENDLTHVIHNYVLPEYENGTVDIQGMQEDINNLTDKYVDLSKRYSDQYNRINEIDEKLDNVDKTLSDKDKSLERKLKDATTSILIIVICIVGFGLLLIWLTVGIDKRLTNLENNAAAGTYSGNTTDISTSGSSIKNGVLPCPMCGSKNIKIISIEGTGDVTNMYSIKCNDCWLEPGCEYNKEDLIYKWNHMDR